MLGSHVARFQEKGRVRYLQHCASKLLVSTLAESSSRNLAFNTAAAPTMRGQLVLQLLINGLWEEGEGSQKGLLLFPLSPLSRSAAGDTSPRCCCFSSPPPRMGLGPPAGGKGERRRRIDPMGARAALSSSSLPTAVESHTCSLYFPFCVFFCECDCRGYKTAPT